MNSRCTASMALSALFAGWFTMSPNTASVPQAFGVPNSVFLVDLHLHGSLSERQGTMLNHTRQAMLAGYDGLWWTDHVEKTMSRYFVHRVRFEQDLDGDAIGGYSTPNGRFAFEPPTAGSGSLSYSTSSPPEGNAFARVELTTLPSDPWLTASLVYSSENETHHASLFSRQVLHAFLRNVVLSGDAGVVLRVGFTSAPDGWSREGIPFALEYFAPGSSLPAPPQGTQRIPLAMGGGGTWSQIQLDLLPEAEAFWDVDLGLREMRLSLYARSGGACAIDVDDFFVEQKGPTDLQLFETQREYLETRLNGRLFHEIGMEVGGPEHLNYLTSNQTEHLIALFPNNVPALPNLLPSNPASYTYPSSGVSWIRKHGGVAVLAHVFGTRLPPHELTNAEAAAVRARVVGARAWSADAMEVGYYHRGRPLQDHLQVWDDLSQRRAYVTGVGVSDNHWVKPWRQLDNRMGTWIRAAAPVGSELCASVKSGDVFFGDPFLFDPDGDFLLDEASGRYRMGDVAITSGTESLRLRVQGAAAGMQLRLLHNGVLASSSPPLAGTSGSLHATLAVMPGDWVRAELRGPGGEPVLFSNPVYFIEPGWPVPLHRAP